MKPRGALKRTKGLRAVSPKRRAELARREEVRHAVLIRDGFRCVAAGDPDSPPCWGPLDVHEILPRARGGDYLDTEICVSLCRVHHDHVHTHESWALERGLLVHSWQ